MKKIVLGMIVFVLLLTGCTNNIEDGVLLLEEAKYEEAIKVFDKDIERGKKLDEAYRGVGLAYFELEEYDKAVDALKKALKNGAEETATICGVLGACYMKQELYDEALAVYKKALKKEDITDKLKQEIEYNLIAVYEYTYDWEAAKKQAEKYVENYPDDARIEKEAEFLETR